MKRIAIVGGGPAALMLSAQIDTEKYKVTLYEKNKAVGRKFLVAGVGGLNLTYDTDTDDLVKHYSPSAFMAPIIQQFTIRELRQWLYDRGIDSYAGSSHRVFPDEALKPIDVLNKIVHQVVSNKVDILYEHKWIGWGEDGQLLFEGEEVITADLVVFALGGASWSVTGSDGKWATLFEQKGVRIEELRAANCAFAVDWDETFITAHQGKPLKNIGLQFQDHYSKGELVLTTFGLEGNAIYAMSESLQNSLSAGKDTVVHLDLKPSMTTEQLLTKYKKSKRSKVTEILQKDLNLDRASIGLLKQYSSRETFLNPELLVALIKAVPIKLLASDGLDKAISSLGGIAVEAMDDNFQLHKLPHTYAIGEMVDWYAPTGGYLLQGCFSMGYVLAEHLNGL